ncbi:hypothetical protein KY331_02695 [Candidatus Woesearchaeota archaeon]|nr:hypothetical protein [Candidatus Woesearchaeota archaeon]
MGQQYRGREVMRIVVDFVNTLGHLPENCPNDETAMLLASIRDDIKKAYSFHTNTNIDDMLDRAETNLESAIAQGLTEHEIEFLRGVRGVTAERCYQTGRILSNADLLIIKDSVYDDYIHLADAEAVAMTEQTYAGLRQDVKEAEKLAKKLLKKD